jgi:hypothetical protein
LITGVRRRPANYRWSTRRVSPNLISGRRRSRSGSRRWLVCAWCWWRRRRRLPRRVLGGGGRSSVLRCRVPRNAVPRVVAGSPRWRPGHARSAWARRPRHPTPTYPPRAFCVAANHSPPRQPVPRAAGCVGRTTEHCGRAGDRPRPGGTPVLHEPVPAGCPRNNPVVPFLDPRVSPDKSPCANGTCSSTGPGGQDEHLATRPRDRSSSSASHLADRSARSAGPPAGVPATKITSIGCRWLSPQPWTTDTAHHVSDHRSRP